MKGIKKARDAIQNSLSARTGINSMLYVHKNLYCVKFCMIISN